MKMASDFIKFHTSGAAGMKSGQINLKRNSSMTNVEGRLTNVELRNSFYFFVKKSRAKRHPPFVNCHSSFVIPCSFTQEVQEYVSQVNLER